MSTIRKPADILLGGQPRAKSAPAGAPPQTTMLGRNEAMAAETINRGTYSVAEQLDLVAQEYFKLARKAVTKAAQKNFAVAAATNVLTQTSDDADPVSAYVGVNDGESPARLAEILQAGTSSQYQQQAEGCYTVFKLSGTELAVLANGNADIAFQWRTFAAYDGVLTLQLTAAGAPALNVVAGANPGDWDVEYEYVAGVTEFDDLAAAINADATLNLISEAYGANTHVISAYAAAGMLPTNYASPVRLWGKASVDVETVGVFSDNAITGSDLPVPDRCVVKYGGATSFTLVTDMPNTLDPVAAGDYVVISAFSPSLAMGVPAPTGRHQLLKVLSVSGGASIGDTVTFVGAAAAFTLVTDVGAVDEDDLVFVMSRYKPQYWAIGSSAYYDKTGLGYDNPETFGFGDSDDLHWFQGTAGIPVIDYATSVSNITRVANLKSVFALPAGITTPSQITDTSINAEIVSPGLQLYNVASPVGTRRVLLVQPRTAGTLSPRLSLSELRIVVSAALLPGATVAIYPSASPDPTAVFDTAAANIRTASLERAGSTASGKPIYRIDPASLQNGTPVYAAMPSTNTNFFYKVVLDVASGETAVLERSYFEGAHAGSPIFKIKHSGGGPRKQTFTDVELWIGHEGGDPDAGLVSTVYADLYLSTTGLANSYSKVKSDVALVKSHIVAKGLYDNIHAYRAQMFPEGYDLIVDSTQTELYLLVHVKQPGNASTHRRVLSAMLYDAHKNSSDQIGSFIGADTAGIGANPATFTAIVDSTLCSTGGSNGVTSATRIFEDTPLAPFGSVAIGDYLHIMNGPNLGHHRITSISATQLGLATQGSTSSGPLVNDDGTGASGAIRYAIYRNSHSLFPAGVEGGTRLMQVVMNCDILPGVPGVDLGVGSYSKLIDAAPDSFRASAGSIGDTGFLVAKLAEVMGTAVTETVPAARNLVGLDNRINELRSATIGLGTLAPVYSFGRYNITTYGGNMSATIAAAAADLAAAGGGVIVVRPGTYSLWNANTPIPANIVLKAESKGTVVFELGAADKISLNADNGGLVDITVRGLVTVGNSATTTKNMLSGITLTEGGGSVGRIELGASGNTLTDIVIEGLDATATNATAVVIQTMGNLVLNGLTMSDVKLFGEGADSSGRTVVIGNMATANVSNLYLDRFRGALSLSRVTKVRSRNCALQTVVAQRVNDWVSMADRLYSDTGGTRAFSVSDQSGDIALLSTTAIYTIDASIVGGIVKLDSTVDGAKFTIVDLKAQITQGANTTVIAAVEVGASGGFGDLTAVGIDSNTNCGVRVMGTGCRTRVSGVRTRGFFNTASAATAPVHCGVAAVHLEVSGLLAQVADNTNNFVSGKYGVISAALHNVLSDITVNGSAVALQTGGSINLSGSASQRSMLSNVQLGDGTIVSPSGKYQLSGSFNGGRSAFHGGEGAYASVDSPDTLGGSELWRHGTPGTATFRMWKFGSQVYMTLNVGSITTAPVLKVGNVTAVSPVITKEYPGVSVLVVLGSQDSNNPPNSIKMSHTSFFLGDSDPLIGSGGSQTLEPAMSLRGLTSFGTTFDPYSKSAIDLLLGLISFGPSIKIQKFTDGMVLAVNMQSSGTSAVAVDTPQWQLSDSSKQGYAVAFRNTVSGAYFSSYAVPAGTSSNFTLNDTEANDFITDGGGTVYASKRFKMMSAVSNPLPDSRLAMGLVGTVAGGKPTTTVSPHVPSTRIVGPFRTVPTADAFSRPPLIVAPGKFMNHSIVLGFGDELANAYDRVGLTVDTVSGYTTAPSVSNIPRLFKDNNNVFSSTLSAGVGVFRVVFGSALSHRSDPYYRPALKFKGSRPAGVTQVSVIVTTSAGNYTSTWSAANPQAYDNEENFGLGSYADGFLLLPPITTSMHDVQSVTVYVYGSIGTLVELDRLFLYHASSPVLGNISPSWEDMVSYTKWVAGAQLSALGSGNFVTVGVSQSGKSGNVSAGNVQASNFRAYRVSSGSTQYRIIVPTGKDPSNYSMSAIPGLSGYTVMVDIQSNEFVLQMFDVVGGVNAASVLNVQILEVG